MARKHFLYYFLSWIFFFFPFPSLLLINPERKVKKREKRNVFSFSYVFCSNIFAEQKCRIIFKKNKRIYLSNFSTIFLLSTSPLALSTIFPPSHLPIYPSFFTLYYFSPFHNSVASFICYPLF